MSAPIPPTDIPDWGDFYDAAKTAALTRTDKIDDKSFTTGNLWDIIAGIGAALGEEDAQIALQLFLKTFFSTASGADLDALAGDHFNLQRIEGQQAYGALRFSRPNTGANVSIPVNTQVATTENLVYLVVNTVTLVGTEVEVLGLAVEVGEAGNVDPDTVTQIISPLSDTDVKVTNPEQMAGGSATETDSRFRERILSWFQTLRRGTLLALETGALFVPGVAVATADDSNYPPTVYVADATGGANATLIAAVNAEMINWRAAGIPTNVEAAIVTNINISLTVVFRAGFDVLAVRTSVIEAAVAAVNVQKIGEVLYHSEITAPVQAVNGVHSVVVTNPPGAVAPAVNEVLRTTESLVVVS